MLFRTSLVLSRDIPPFDRPSGGGFSRHDRVYHPVSGESPDGFQDFSVSWLICLTKLLKITHKIIQTSAYAIKSNNNNQDFPVSVTHIG